MNTKTNWTKKLSLSFLALGATTLSSFAQDSDSLQTKQLNEVVISASKILQAPNEIGRSITVLNSSDIQNSIYNNAAELLSQQEGIYIVGTGQNPGSLQSMYLRGANSEHTSIFIDGVRITDPSSVDNGINLAELSLANIERIEIVRGSHSTLYGSSAIGGSINIITKRGGKKGLSGNVSAEAGTFGESTSQFTENIALNYSLGNGFYATAELYNTNVKGLDATVDTVKADIFKNRDQDNFDKLDVIGKVGYQDNKWDAFISYKKTDQISDIDDGAYRDDDNYTVDFKRDLINYQLAYRFSEKLNLNFVGGYTDMSRLALDDSSVVDTEGNTDGTFSSSEYEGSVLNNELQLRYQSDFISLIAGLSNYKETMTSRTYYYSSAWDYKSESNLDSLGIEATINSAFLHTTLNGGLVSNSLKGFNLALGGRLNDHSTFGNNFTYEINPSYKINKTLVYASYGAGFNAPALYRLYSPNQNFISEVTRGNLDLEPETSTSFELGVKQQIGKSTEITISAYQTVVDNLIEYVYLWDKEIPIEELGNDWMRNDSRGDTYINAGEQTNKGIEVTLRSQLSNQLLLTGNFSYTEGDLKYDPSYSDFTNDYYVQLYSTGDFLTKEVEVNGLVRRSNTFNASLTYIPIQKLRLSADIRHVGRRNDIFYDNSLGPWGALGQNEVDSYTLTGFTANYNIMDGLNATLRVDNLFDVDYQEIYGYTTRGRSFYLRLNYSF
ncbi:TonB-dependent receptor plug domain-containing protein [Sediminitomix flava]|uniref:Outer membrane cobalamin receptor n=1 Tax=Sediminitomix flava TaxID=379075 RepID=A0A315ZDY6_SEDFL|nr:TonB-dependent receptor [Sediminitomix flava]PWJ43038.1 outer membrane cobalamin receptor [Sediminitomix flava]